MKRSFLAALALVMAGGVAATAQPKADATAQGFYRFPTLRGGTVVFAAEGDLWAVPVEGGGARRLTTHPAQESDPMISPDGKTLAFTARYEGPVEVYTMPLEGGVPTRRTYGAEASTATAWTPSGDLVYTTQHFATLPDPQLVKIDLKTGERSRVPLSPASEGAYDASGRTLYFVRPAFHNNVTKRYKGGQARKIWKYTEGAAEAQVLTESYAGESHSPQWWNGRVYFVSDRDGTMNIWSMDEKGGDLRPHTRHAGWDVKRPALDAGRLVYQVGADLWLLDLATGTERLIPITLPSDFDQLREKWAKKPMEFLTSVHLHPKGDSAVLTARGRVFVAPAGPGRLVTASRKAGVRYRNVRFMPDGKSLLALSDSTGELEFATLPGNGVGEEKALTSDGKVLRFDGQPSPDGKWIGYTDNNNGVWLFNLATKEQIQIAPNREGGADLAWSPDSRWIAWSQSAANSFAQILIYNVETRKTTPLTSDRVNSVSAGWSPDGAWLYFLSDRNMKSVVDAPWGPRQPEPFFDRPMKVYQVALRKGLRSSFKPADELHQDATEKAEAKPEAKTRAGASPVPSPSASPASTASAVPPIDIDLDGLATRIYEVPAGAGDFSSLTVTAKTLFFRATDPGAEGKTHLMALEIANKDPKPVRVMEDITSYEVSADGKKMLVRKKDDSYIIDAGPKAPAPADLGKSRLDLSGWTFPLDVREDWRQIFVDAWRMERDYFYDPNMHGVDWNGVLKRHLPLVDRITTREELSDLIGWMVGELSVLHTSVRGGDLRLGPDDVKVPTLGAHLVRDAKAGGYRIDHIYRHDPDYPDERSPLGRSRAQHQRGRRDSGSERRRYFFGRAIRSFAARRGEAAGSPSRQGGEFGPLARGRGRAHHRREKSPLHRLGVFKTPRGGREIGRPARLRASARHGGRGCHGLVSEFLSRLQPSGHHHRREAQQRREHRQLPPRKTHAPGLDVLEESCGRTVLEHAVRAPRPPGGSGRRQHRLGRRGLRRRFPPPGPGQGDRRQDLGRRGLALRSEPSHRRRCGAGAHERCLWSGRRVAHRESRPRSRHRGRQSSSRHFPRTGRSARRGDRPSAHRDQEGSAGGSEAPRVSRQVFQVSPLSARRMDFVGQPSDARPMMTRVS